MYKVVYFLFWKAYEMSFCDFFSALSFAQDFLEWKILQWNSFNGDFITIVTSN